MLFYRALLPFFCLLSVPAHAEISATSVFASLCVQGGMRPLSGDPPDGFPSATRIDQAQMLQDIPADLGFELVEAWDLLPGSAPGAGLAIAVGYVQHPGLGEMAACMILAEQASSWRLQRGLTGLNAEFEGGLYWIESAGRLWMVRVSGWPEVESGEGIVMGVTPNKPVAD